MTNSSDLAVFSVVHPGTLAWLPDFLASLRAQTDRAFVLWLALDEVPAPAPDLLAHLGNGVVCVRTEGTPVDVRQQALRQVLEAGHEGIVLLDSDDVASPGHVSVCRGALDRTDVVALDLSLWDGSTKPGTPWLSSRLQSDSVIRHEDLLDANCLGGGNTAVRARILQSSLSSIPNDIVAFDWALYARALLGGARALFLDAASVSYRQHPNNTAGPLDLSDRSIRRGVSIKLSHYESLREHGEAYETRAQAYRALHARLASAPSFGTRYCEAIRERWRGKMPLWWEAISSSETLGI